MIADFDAVIDRWNKEPPKAQTWFWRQSGPFSAAPARRDLQFEASAHFTLTYGVDGAVQKPLAAEKLPFGLWGARLPSRMLEEPI